MIKLGDLLIDDETATVVRAFLDSLLANHRAKIARAERERWEDERDSRWHEKVMDLAKQTARLNGVIEGLAPGYAAAATWEAFIASEGWFSPFDIDEHFDTGAKYADDYRETWELAYLGEIEAIKH